MEIPQARARRLPRRTEIANMARTPYRLEPRGKKGILWIRFTAPGGREIYRSAGTADRSLATEWASRIHAEHYRVARLGEKAKRRWTEAVTAWLDGHATKRSIKKDMYNLRWLDPFLGDKLLEEIDADLIESIAKARRDEPRDKRRRKDGGTFSEETTSQATVDRLLALLRSVLRDANKRGWLDRLPNITLLAAPHEDYRWLSRDEAAALHAELADHLKPLLLFSLSTGLREQNVLRLEWQNVDVARGVMWVKAAAAKGKKPIGVPLNRDAIDILRAQKGRHGRWVFPSESGKPYDRANNSGFRAAQIRARIAPLKWHDLRHTWASWHVMAGTSLRSLMDLGGWRSIQSVLRYAHMSPEHLAGDAARVEGFARKLHG